MDCYRKKIRSAIESTMQDVTTVAPTYETRRGRRLFNEWLKRAGKAEMVKSG